MKTTNGTGASASSRQQRVDREHHRRREHDRERVLGDEDQPVAEEEADRLQVDRRPRHQLAGLLGVEEAELERLQVRVEALAQVELDRQRDLAGDQAPDHGQPEPQDAGADDRQRQRQEVVAVARRSIALTALPTSSGISTVIPIATQAKTSDQISGRR